MANLPKDGTQYPEYIYQIASDDPVQGGANGIDNLPHQQLANRTTFLKKAVNALEDGKAGLANKLLLQLAADVGFEPPAYDATKADTWAWLKEVVLSLTDTSKTQTTAWTGLDSLPVGSISPLLFSATGMSEKWTFANGSKIPETQPIIDWFNNDPLGFIANWNATCALVGAAPITLADGLLAIPDLMGYGIHLKAGSAGILQEASKVWGMGHNGGVAMIYGDNWGLYGATNTYMEHNLDDVGNSPKGVGSGAYYHAVYGPENNFYSYSYGKIRPRGMSTPVYFKIA